MKLHGMAPAAATLFAIGLFLAAGGRAAEPPPTTPVQVNDATFGCIRKMTAVRHFYVDNLLGNLAGTLAAANAPKGAVYPPGSVVQLVGKNCFGCHVPAREPWDYICESGHNCAPLPIDHAMTDALQRSDPRCGAPEPQPGDTVALWKLRALVLTGTAMNWVKSWF